MASAWKSLRTPTVVFRRVSTSRRRTFAASNRCIASSNKCLTTSNKCLTTSNNKLLSSKQQKTTQLMRPTSQFGTPADEYASGYITRSFSKADRDLGPIVPLFMPNTCSFTWRANQREHKGTYAVEILNLLSGAAGCKPPHHLISPSHQTQPTTCLKGLRVPVCVTSLHQT